MTEREQSLRPRQDTDWLVDIVATPNRSLSKNGMVWVLGAVAGLLCLLGAYWLWRGAWPVTLLMGLEWAALAWALHWSRSRNREREVIRLSPSRFEVTRVARDGRQTRWVEPPAWLQITELRRADGTLFVEARSRGQACELGRCLSSAERGTLATRLKEGLRRARQYRGA
jgi:uncharacterized membrane protein